MLAREFHDARRRADLEAADAEARGPQLQAMHAEHGLGGRRQWPEAVDHLHLQVVELRRASAAPAMRL